MLNKVHEAPLRMRWLRGRACAALVAAAAICGTSASFAAPSISSASGPVEHGQRITLTGSGFGTKPQAAPLLWDTVDNHYSAASVTNGATVDTSVFREISNTSAIRFAKQSSWSRTPLSSLSYQGTGNSWLAHPAAAGGTNPPQSQRKLYISWWTRFSHGPYENNASHKFVRIWAGGDNDLRVSWTQRQLTVQNSNAGGTSALSRWAGDVWGAPGRWHLHEMWVDADTGTIKIWVNGKIVHDFQSDDSRYLKRSHPTGLNLSLLGWNPSHGTFGTAQTFQMDDIVVDNTLARVVLSNASTWSQAQVREYQPATSWSSSQISITANLGQLDKSKPIYAYVVAADGSVNANGFPLNGNVVRPQAPTLTVQ
jgi:hypothetical protein